MKDAPESFHKQNYGTQEIGSSVLRPPPACDKQECLSLDHATLHLLYKKKNDSETGYNDTLMLINLMFIKKERIWKKL